MIQDAINRVCTELFQVPGFMFQVDGLTGIQ